MSQRDARQRVSRVWARTQHSCLAAWAQAGVCHLHSTALWPQPTSRVKIMSVTLEFRLEKLEGTFKDHLVQVIL